MKMIFVWFLKIIGELKLTEIFSNIRHSFTQNIRFGRQIRTQPNPSKIEKYVRKHIFETFKKIRQADQR